MIIIEEDAPAPETIAAIDKGLDDYNLSRIGNIDHKDMWLIARDDVGTLRGGLRAVTFFDWCFVKWLWVDASCRGKGIGSDLLRRSETAARQRHCIGIYLDTFSFQAPEFYARHGYEECGRIDDIPKGQSRIWFKKMLSVPL